MGMDLCVGIFLKYCGVLKLLTKGNNVSSVLTEVSHWPVLTATSSLICTTRSYQAETQNISASFFFSKHEKLLVMRLNPC